MRKMLIGLLVALFMVSAIGTAWGDSLPSSKVAVALGAINIIQASDPNTSPSDFDTGWNTILSTSIKAAEQKDLIFNVSLECGIYTDTLVKSKNLVSDTSKADAAVYVRVKVTDQNNNVSYAAPNGNSADPLFGAHEGVTFNRRLQQLTATLQGFLTEGVVTDYESIDLLQKTMEANAFNFLLANVGAGIMKIEVQAKLTGESTYQNGSAQAKAAIGLGSLITESVRLIKDADGTPTLQ